jgi:SAM-dependent methyltransferase
VTDTRNQPVNREHYLRDYDSIARFASYWHQIHEVTQLGGSVLEVGVGNGTVNAVLRRRGLAVQTVDIDPTLEPDLVADIRDLPLPDAAFDTALVGEVLEHLPWSDVDSALAEVARVVRRGAVISVPHAGAWFSLLGQVPGAIHIVRLALRRKIAARHALWSLTLPATWQRHGGRVAVTAFLPGLRRDVSPSCGEHCWELGLRGLEPTDLRAAISRAGLEVIRDYRPAENPYHHFFVATRAEPR